MGSVAEGPQRHRGVMTNSRTLHAKSPADVLAVVPYVLGFHPADSLVLLTVEGEDQLHARVDLPPDAADVCYVVEELLPAVRRRRPRRVVLVVYSHDHWLAREAVECADDLLGTEGVAVLGALRADGERWFPLLPESGDALADGVPYDVSAHPFTAQAVLDGQITYASRQQLADSLVGTDPDAFEEVGRAADEAMRRFQAVARHPLGTPQPEAARRHLVAEAHWVQDRLRRFAVTREPLDAEEAGRMLVALVSIEVRDVAWSEITRFTAGAHVELWRQLLLRTPLDLAAAPAALLGFAAWLSGDGALAWCAVERCQRAEPEYSLAGLLVQALTAGVPPTAWQPLSPDEFPLFTG
jgi:hypothetical protein